MKTTEHNVSREVHDRYVAKINNLIENGRESLISSLVAEFDQVDRAKSCTNRKAA